MIARLFNRAIYYPRALTFRTLQSLTRLPSLEDVVSPLELTPKKSQELIKESVQGDAALNLPFLETLFSVSNRHHNSMTFDKKLCEDLAYKLSLQESTETKPLIKVLTSITKIMDQNNVVAVDHLTKIIMKSNELDMEAISALNNMDLVRTISVVYAASPLTPYREKTALNILSVLLKKDSLETNVMKEILLLPSPLLRKVPRELESAVLASPAQNLPFDDKLALAQKIIELYDEHVGVDMVEKYFEGAIEELRASTKAMPIKSMEKLLSVIALIQKKVPHYYMRRIVKNEFFNNCRVIKQALNLAKAPFELEIEFRNALCTFDNKADAALHTIEQVHKNVHMLSVSSVETLTKDMLEFIHSTNYVFDLLAHNRFYTSTLQSMMENRSMRFKILTSILKESLEHPDTHKSVLAMILSDPSAGKVLEMLPAKVFGKVMKFMESYAKGKGATLQDFPFDLIKNCILAKPEPLLSVPPEKIIHTVMNEKQSKEYFEILAKYTEIIFSPCADDQAYFKESRETLKKSSESIIAAFNKLHLDKNAPKGSFEEIKNAVSYMLPIYYYLAKPESVYKLIGKFWEIPKSLLAEFTPTQLKQFLLLCLKSNVIY